MTVSIEQGSRVLEKYTEICGQCLMAAIVLRNMGKSLTSLEFDIFCTFISVADGILLVQKGVNWFRVELVEFRVTINVSSRYSS